MNFLLGLGAGYLLLKALGAQQAQAAAQAQAQATAAAKPVTVEPQTTAAKVGEVVGSSIANLFGAPQAPQGSGQPVATTTTSQSAWNTKSFVNTGGKIRQSIISAFHTGF